MERLTFLRMSLPAQTLILRRRLVRWYVKNRRDLPWRRTRDPYAILISEIMLQQTQVATAMPYYDGWLKRFPTFAQLASATEAEVLHQWQGLGYYSRARNLHAAAKLVVSRHNGILPTDPEAMRRLPGLGRYTANAVATFAFDQSVPIVETNITRVIARLFNIRVAVDSSDGRERLWKAAESLVPIKEAAIFNSALMELGALVCLKTPRCTACPVKTFCRADRPGSLPIKAPRPTTVHLTEVHAFVRRGDKILLEKSSGRWRGMWMLPGLPKIPQPRNPLHSAVFPFTHHRVNLQVFSGRVTKLKKDQKWMPLEWLDRIPIPSPHRRAITDLVNQCSHETPVGQNKPMPGR